MFCYLQFCMAKFKSILLRQLINEIIGDDCRLSSLFKDAFILGFCKKIVFTIQTIISKKKICIIFRPKKTFVKLRKIICICKQM